MSIVNELSKRKPDILFTIEEASDMQFLFAHTTYGHHMLCKIPQDIDTLCVNDIIKQLEEIMTRDDNKNDDWIKAHLDDFIIAAIDYDSHNIALSFHPYIRRGDLAFICSLKDNPMYRLPFSNYVKQNLDFIYQEILKKYKNKILKNTISNFTIVDELPFKKDDIKNDITLQSESEIYYIFLYQEFWDKIEKLNIDIFIRLPDDHTIILLSNKQNAEYFYDKNKKIYKKV